MISAIVVPTIAQAAYDRSPQSLPSLSDATIEIDGSGDYLAYDTTCFEGPNHHFATNENIWLGEKSYPSDTYLNVYRNNDTLKIIVNLDDDSGDSQDEYGSFDTYELPLAALSCDQLTQIPLVEDPETGEIRLGGYTLPIDLLYAVTYCYREVKAVVRNQIKLTGGSAYMAERQLVDAGWVRNMNYNTAPNGAICVFGKGGKVTRSGGHKHGHIGIKGRGGVINPASGFSLKRPFKGCFTPPGSRKSSFTRPAPNRAGSLRNNNPQRGQSLFGGGSGSCTRSSGSYRCDSIPFGTRQKHQCTRINKPNTKYHRHWICKTNPRK